MSNPEYLYNKTLSGFFAKSFSVIPAKAEIHKKDIASILNANTAN